MAECSLLVASVLISFAALAIFSVLPHVVCELKRLSHHYEPYWGWQIRPAWVAAVVVASLGSGVLFNLVTRSKVEIVACGSKPNPVVKVACR